MTIAQVSLQIASELAAQEVTVNPGFLTSEREGVIGRIVSTQGAAFMVEYPAAYTRKDGTAAAYWVRDLWCGFECRETVAADVRFYDAALWVLANNN